MPVHGLRRLLLLARQAERQRQGRASIRIAASNPATAPELAAAEKRALPLVDAGSRGPALTTVTVGTGVPRVGYHLKTVRTARATATRQLTVVYAASR